MVSRSLGGPNPGPRIGPVIISELMYAPTNDDLEYIELYNTTAATINLSNWKFSNGVDFTFASGTTIAAHSTMLVTHFDPVANAAQLAAFRATYGIGANVTIVGPYSGVLNNSGEKIELDMPDTPDPADPTFVPYVVGDEFTYSAIAPWPQVNSSLSLTRVSATAWGGDSTTWRAAAPNAGVFDVVAPTASVVAITPNPHTAPVSQITISFSEAVTGFDLTDLRLTRDGGGNLLATGSYTLTSSDNVTWVLGGLTSATTPVGAYTLLLVALGSGVTDASGNALALNASGTFQIVSPTAVVDHHVFYNDSYFDNGDSSANVLDDNAIDPTKHVLLPGQTATFANYSSYVRGINGLMIDMTGPLVSLGAADFIFKVGNSFNVGDLDRWPATRQRQRSHRGQWRQ